MVGVLTRRDILSPRVAADAPVATLVGRPPVVVFEDSTLREAADLMVAERVGRVMVVAREAPLRPVGVLTRSDLLDAHESRLAAARATPPRFGRRRRR
jgi:CIC family chloride channel protein